MPGIKCSPSSFIELFTPINQNVNTVIVDTVNLSIGNWVVVNYDECSYAGKVIQVVDNNIEISDMGKFEKWLKQKDKADTILVKSLK